MIPGLFTLLAAHAALPPAASLTYDVSVAGKQVGTRVVEVRYETSEVAPTRVITARTELSAEVGGVPIRYKQKLTGVAGLNPASFHAVIDEGGVPREVQASWHAGGWTITTVEGPRARTADVPGYRVDVSTLDLMDPGTRYPIERYGTLQVLSAETGEIWTGQVAVLGADPITVAGKKVDTNAFSWTSPEGVTKLWYDGEGWLVRYEMRVAGVTVTGQLRAPPPPGPDVFPTGLGQATVVVEDL